MISYEAVLIQMERLVQNAKQSQNEQYVREQLTAVKALCDVVLVQPSELSPRQGMSASSAVPAMQANPGTFLQQTASSDRLQEPDANGDSIFDF
ncbi:MAG: YwdI family protein [Lysinibacillus sp.]